MIISEKIQLIQGECLEEMKRIPDGSVDMILCDLPYGTTANQWDHIIPIRKIYTFLTKYEYFYYGTTYI